MRRATLDEGCPYYAQTLDDSFSAVWTATIASKDAFFSIFRDLQDLHSFGPLKSQNLQIFRNFFAKISGLIFIGFLQNLLNFCEISGKINKNFDANLQNFRDLHGANGCKSCRS